MKLYIGLILTVITGVLGVRNSDIKETSQVLFRLPGRKYKREAVSTVQAMCEAVPRNVWPRILPRPLGKPEIPYSGEFPFMGSLMYRNDRTKRCGAALITRKLLLAAAHCFRRGNATQVRLGTNSASDTGAEPYGIARVVLHPKYDRIKSTNDIAIVELNEEVDFSDVNIAPLCLHDSTEDLSTDENLTVVGWGWGMTDGDSLLRFAMKPILRSTCRPKFTGTRFTVSDSHLCAEMKDDSNADACMGAFGGPLVKLEGDKYHLVGITSYVYDCGLRNYPGIYTRVANYLDWITEQVKELS